MHRLDSCYENSDFLFRATCVITKNSFSQNNNSTPKAKISVRSDPIRSSIRSWFCWRPVKTSWIMMMQPSTTMIKILIFHNYSRKPSSFHSNICTLTICLTCTRCVRERQESECMRMDSAERLTFSYMYSNTQFRQKAQSI